MSKLARMIAQISIVAGHEERARTTRRFLLGCAKMLRKDPAGSRRIAADLGRIEAFTRATRAQWVDTIADGGPFDGCDLRIWLALAEQAGVPRVPARTILSLDEPALEALSATVTLPTFMRNGLARLARSVFGPPAEDDAGEDEARPDPEALRERLFDAMDDVPDGWIVRSHICGPALLKARAGTGLLERDTTMPANQALEVGPGWVRHGNRRRVDATDERYLKLFPGAHGPALHYLARPWVEASRRVECDDPHRHGSVFAGKGSWPCEWRVFFEDATVTGVAFYYGWAGAATPENARKALEAKSEAEAIIAAGVRLGLRPQLMDIEIVKHHISEGAHPGPAALEAVARFGEGFSGTLDFIETAQGMTLIEGGPGHTPIGGGHPCAFAGAARPGTAQTRGVALKLMEHVHLAEPSTWTDGDRAGHVLTWEEAQALAAQETPETEPPARGNETKED